MKKFSYKDSGIDISRTDIIKSELNDILAVKDERVLNKVGAFASLFDISNMKEYDKPVLVLKAEEPGSKQKIALENGKVGSVCHDMINHLVNDIAVMGAKPLAVLDVIITGAVNEDVTKEIVSQIALACKNNECTLVGGETSIQPGIVGSDLVVLSSTVTGIVEKSKIIDGSKISIGDSVVAIASNGVHTNGYTLIRTLMENFPELAHKKLASGNTFLEEILIPHTSYFSLIMNALKKTEIHGMAHITGGGIEGNLCRIIPNNMVASIDLSHIKTLEIFKTIKEVGNINDKEMLTTFNCGVGLVMVLPKENFEILQKVSAEANIECYEIGTIIPTTENKKIEFKGELLW